MTNLVDEFSFVIITTSFMRFVRVVNLSVEEMLRVTRINTEIYVSHHQTPIWQLPEVFRCKYVAKFLPLIPIAKSLLRNRSYDSHCETRNHTVLNSVELFNNHRSKVRETYMNEDIHRIMSLLTLYPHSSSISSRAMS